MTGQPRHPKPHWSAPDHKCDYVKEAVVGRTRGAGARKEGDLQSPVRESDREAAPGEAKDAVGRQCASGCHIPGGQGSAGFG